MSKLSNNDIIAFKAISEFITEMSETYGKKQKSLSKYGRLISATTLTHHKPILKHVDKFRTFVIANRDAIQNKKSNMFNIKEIKYSDNVYINIEDVFKIADINDKVNIWRHLLTISGLLDKESNAKSILKESGAEGEFINQAFEEIKMQMDNKELDKSNPMAMAMSLLTGGTFQKLIGGLTEGVESGNIEVEKLMGTVTKMMNNEKGVMKELTEKTEIVEK
jgi:hypothetical protein